VRTLVLTVLGDDHPGIVEALARVIADGGGSWDRSHMSRLAGKFAGIVEVTVEEGAHRRVIVALEELSSGGALEVTVEIADSVEELPQTQLALHLLGSDRPGIVHEISGAMAALGVGIVELETETTSAPMAGELLFAARVVLQAPPDIEVDRVRAAIEELANELMVDVELSTG
jgi:glycine cleavage system regulatory protein